MLTNFETDKVFIAKGLCSGAYCQAADSLISALDTHHVEWEQLPCTESDLHIWARDYMPVQVSVTKFVKFNYTPDYLRNGPEYKPDTSAILSELGLTVIDSDLVIDGGNVVSCGDKVIMTDKIFRENPRVARPTLVDSLACLLEAEMVLIPEDVYEEYGHADGMVRYMGGGNVLLNNYCDFDKALRKKLLAALSPHFNITELHYGHYTDNSWAYLNFLHLGQHIFVPMIDDKLGETAFKQIADAYPNCQCHPVMNCDNIISEGGALNCSTWNILTNLIVRQEFH
jgi:agmatine/peptidylarginine deiminase